MPIDFTLSDKMKRVQDMSRMFAETCVRPYALESDAMHGPHPKFIEACKQFGLGATLGLNLRLYHRLGFGLRPL